jgi:hypothetical protein
MNVRVGYAFSAVLMVGLLMSACGSDEGSSDNGADDVVVESVTPAETAAPDAETPTATAAPDAETWDVAVAYAVEQIEISFRGETWGVQVEDAAPMSIEVSAATAAHLAEGSAARAPLEVGAVVGEFDL